MPAPEIACRRWVVEGRVQGVGFRWFVSLRAREHGLAGWVANQDDGSVEVVARAAPAVLERLEAELRKGPPGSKVIRLTSSEVPHDVVDGNSFIVKH